MNQRSLIEQPCSPTTRPAGLSSRAIPVAASMLAFMLAASVGLTASAQTIVQQDLVLTQDQVGPLWVFTSNITIDCRGFRVIEPTPVDQEQQDQPGNGRAGILIYNVSGVTVRNCRIEDFWFGIRAVISSEISLIDNTVIENAAPTIGWTVRDAFRIEGGSDNVLIGNIEADTNGDGFVLVNSSDNALSGNAAGGGGNGYWLLTSHRNQLTNNTTTDSGGGDGVQIHESSSNRLVANTISGQYAGIRIQAGSQDNALRGNAITNNHAGILVCPNLTYVNSLTPNRFSGNGADIVEGGDTCL